MRGPLRSEGYLLKKMRKEQGKRDKMVKGWVPLVQAGVLQLNALFEKISTTLVNSTGVQLGLNQVGHSCSCALYPVAVWPCDRATC